MYKLPTWAKRVPVEWVRRLYESDAAGLADEVLLDKVAYGLYARCEAIVQVTRTMVDGEIICEDCKRIVQRRPHDHNPEALVACACGWQVTWGQYHRTFAKKQLFGYNALTPFQTFLHNFPKQREYTDKLRCVDLLLHQFHTSLHYETGRPVAQNLLEAKSGKMKDVILFLDELTYGDTQEDMETLQAQWKTRMRQAPWARHYVATDDEEDIEQ